MAARCCNVCHNMNRRKSIGEDVMATPLRRCLTSLDLTCLGIGYMIGPGIYVVTGTVVRSIAGPAAVLSYLFAGLAATLSALCYAEFGCRIPLAGSAYTYTYVSMGEFWAFAIGWNLILEYLIAVASSAKAWSATLDSMCNDTISQGLTTAFGTLNASYLSPYLDVVAFLVVLLAIVFVLAGAKTSARINNILTALIILFILFIIVYGFTFANIKFWTDPTFGGFVPFGWGGVFAGSATCFYAYLGFDGIAVAGEETANPSKSIPVATGVSMLVVTLLYVLVTAALTLMVPFYDVSTMAPFPVAFAMRGVTWAKYVASIGGLLGITTSITGGLYFLPRILYAMASDGLFFQCFAKVWGKTQTPAIAIVTLGVLAGILASIVSLDVLVELMSIGTLLSFTFVSASVIILRFRVPLPTEQTPLLMSQSDNQPSGRKISTAEINEDASVKDFSGRNETESVGEVRHFDTSTSELDCGSTSKTSGSGSRSFCPRQLRNFVNTSLTPRIGGQERLATSVVLVMVILIMATQLMVFFFHGLSSDWWIVLFYVIMAVGITLCLGVLCVLDQTNVPESFKVPCIPWVPTLSITVNIAMIFHLSYLTWIRLTVWMTLGCLIYFLYGMRHSKENCHPEIGTNNNRRPSVAKVTQIARTASMSSPDEEDSIDVMMYDVIE